MQSSKNGFFVLFNSLGQGFRVLSGVHKTREEAELACQEINNNLVAGPFAYVRAPNNFTVAARWRELLKDQLEGKW